MRPRVAPPPGAGVFLYDARALSGEAAGWLGERPGVAAAVRGRLFRGPRGHLGLQPDSTAPPVSGRFVELLPTQLPVLDYLLGGPGSGLERQRVQVVKGLRLVQADAWILTNTTGWRPTKER
jgi:hypothetical protein